MKKIILLSFYLLSALFCEAQYTIIGGDSTNLENNSSFIQLATVPGNIWQIGLPQKTFFGMAYSGSFAVMTDTINQYSNNNFSSFTIEYYDTTNWGFIPSIELGFWHKYETDSLKDGGFVEMSIDSGATWENLAQVTSSLSYPTNFYSSADTIEGNISAFMGTQNTWKYSNYHFQFMLAALQPTNNRENLIAGGFGMIFTQKVMFRFNFKSDNIQTNKAGWIIDNIYIREYDMGGGVHETISATFEVQVYPNPITEKGIIQVVPKNNEHDFMINIYNSVGQLITSSKMDKNNQYIINKSDFNSGMYLYTIINKDGSLKNGKLIIK